MKFSVSDLFFGLVAIFAGKLAVFGMSAGEALGAFVILGSIPAKAVTDYMFPRRPDLFREVLEISEAQRAMQEKLDNQERELTALKFEAVNR